MECLAPIDGKNMTDDWVDMVFDEYSARENKKQCGYVNSEIVEVSWDDEKFVWNVFDGNEETFKVLEHRLHELLTDPKLRTELERIGNSIVQRFYWKD